MKQVFHKFLKKLNSPMLLFVFFILGMFFVLPMAVGAQVVGSDIFTNNCEAICADANTPKSEICKNSNILGSKVPSNIFSIDACTVNAGCLSGQVQTCCCEVTRSFNPNDYYEVPQAVAPKFNMPELQIPIPGLVFEDADVNCSNLADGNYSCSVNWISKYVAAIYNYGLSIGGILAALMLMAGGLLWLTSGGDSGKVSKAKGLIAGSITGLIILFSAYMILYEVNPELTVLKPITIGQVTDNGIGMLGGSDSALNNVVAACLADNELVSIKNIENVIISSSCSDPRLSPGSYNALVEAGKLAKAQGLKLTITSANRTYAKQSELWAEALKKHGSPEIAQKYVAHPDKCKAPSCSGHCGGVAVDVCIEGSSGCSKINSKNAKLNNSDTQKLEAIMNAAGWGRYCGEWWHFQTNLPNRPCS